MDKNNRNDDNDGHKQENSKKDVFNIKELEKTNKIFVKNNKKYIKLNKPKILYTTWMIYMFYLMKD